ncbi:DNA/RNA helicase, superfamily II, SNF2 family [Corynebacterium camporealensis]|uniref:DNA/RNA helicase, superfamily II, SNF2 family n=2 Tax=Corynebacterium camporealensis TaxID=161896 RepID=A0A0F6TAV0_9CORY|nr:DNA/RNA helicase, superfamily II, SNF2 family [Corynebacterium camporealensis]AVH88175.1 DNA/RNA helicase, superfamily II, SNF2 family [Corynebacterium camporealensis]
MLAVMASYLLHGLWLPVSGLSLWIEQVDGHKIVLPANVPDGTFPEVVDTILAKKSFRNRARVSLRTPKGKDVSLMAPVAMFAPDEAITTLSQLEFLDSRSPAATQEQRAAIAPDLYWLLRVYRGLTRFVRAGRVTMRLAYQAGEWYPMWQLASGLGERGWLAEMIAAAPGILTVNNRSLSDDLADELTHWITFMELREYAQAPRPYPWHPFSQALLETTPIKRGRAQLLRALNEWKDSITSVDLQLVFIVEEPDEEEDAMESVWPVRVQVRSGMDSPQPVKEHQLDRGSIEKLGDARRKALDIAPSLQRSLDYGDADGGDWDAFLKTDDLLNFIGQEAAALRKRGYTVLLPKAWANMETKAVVETRELKDPAEGATKTHLGMEKLVAYDWRMSIGDVQLTDEEMQQLVHSKSGLIRLRGEWVMADTAAISKISEYMEQLSDAARKRKKKAMEQAVSEAERAKQLGWEEWPELQAKAEKLVEEYNAGGEDVVSVQELRELALQSLAEEPIEFTGSTWHASLLGGMDSPAPQRVEIPDTVHAELREYQHRGVDWLYWMSRNNIGAVLADDMGLGKTLQLLSLLAVEKSRGEGGLTLVVAPTSVVGNWAREAKRFVPDFNVIVQHGTGRLRGKRLREAAEKADVVITSYGTVGRDFQDLGKVDWDRVVLDEAQAIKNSATRSSKAVRSLPSRHRIALTGTPVENRLSEMRSILDFCNPGVLGSASFFRNHFAKAIEREGNEEMQERLRTLTAPFILRRLKTDPNIIDDLPEKSEQIITVSMTTEQAALYKALVDNLEKILEQKEGMARRGLVLASLTRIKQICNHPAHYQGDGSPVTIKGKHRSGKVEELMRILDTALEAGERVLIFTQYRAFGDILQPYLSQQLGEEIPFLHGGVTKTKRDRMVEDFQSEDGPPAMLLSLKAGGTGLNLTAANIVVHMDRWWNPAVENQATDRAFRIGQRRNVQVYKMITAGTLEESIQDILDGKTELAGAIVGEGEGWLTELNSEQLTSLMSYRNSGDGKE